MQNIVMHAEIVPAEVGAEGKLAWASPSVSRIDIKRTLAGASGTNDGLSPSHPT
jgi:hypothetical protein